MSINRNRDGTGKTEITSIHQSNTTVHRVLHFPSRHQETLYKDYISSMHVHELNITSEHTGLDVNDRMLRNCKSTVKGQTNLHNIFIQLI